jgi:hypothetical protein
MLKPAHKPLIINAIPYEVRLAVLTHILQGKRCRFCGHTLRECNLIKINSKFNFLQRVLSLMHEILHLLNWEMSETQTEFLAGGIFQVLYENNLLNMDEFARYLKGGDVLRKPRKG